MGQRTDLRVCFQAHGKHLAVEPLLQAGVADAGTGVAGIVLGVGGHQYPARVVVGLAGDVQRGGRAGPVGREQAGTLAAFQVDHEYVAGAGLVVHRHVHVLTLFVQGQVRVFGFGVQLHVGLRRDGRVVRAGEVAGVGAGAHAVVGPRNHAVIAGGAHADMVRTRIQVHVTDDAVFLHVPGDHTHALPVGVVHHQAPVAAILRRGTFGFCPGGGGIGPEAFQARTQVTHHATLAAGHVQLVDGHAQAIVGHEVQDVRVGGVPLRFGIAGWTVQHFFVFGRVGVVQVPVAVGGVHQELAAVGVEGLTARWHCSGRCG